MSDSIREQVLKALGNLLAEIKTGNDYNTNMGDNVNRGLRAPLEENDLPGLVLEEGAEDVVVGPLEKNTHLLPVMAHGYITFDDGDTGNWSTIGNQMIADIVKCVGTDTTLGGLAIDIEPGPNFNHQPETETKIKSVEVDFTIQYRTGHLDPYN